MEKKKNKAKKQTTKTQQGILSAFYGEGWIQVKKTLTRHCLGSRHSTELVRQGAVGGRLAQGHDRKVCTGGGG